MSIDVKLNIYCLQRHFYPCDTHAIAFLRRSLIDCGEIAPTTGSDYRHRNKVTDRKVHKSPGYIGGNITQGDISIPHVNFSAVLFQTDQIPATK